jgi:hypothetical protein
MKLTKVSGRVGRLAMVVAIGIGLAVSAQAQTLLVDFGRGDPGGSFRGVTVPNPDANGNTWNSLTPGPFYGGLVDVSGAATTIGLGYTTGVGTDSFNGPAGVTSIPPTAGEIAATDIDTVALGNLGVKEAAMDFAASPGGLNNNTRFEISGLDPLKTYSLTIFGSHKFSDDDSTVYSAYGDAAYTSLLGSASLLVQTPGSPWLHNRDTVATLSNLSPSAGGSLYMNFVGSNGNQGYLNSFQLTGVPEPSSMLLLVSSVGLLFGVRRRS